MRLAVVAIAAFLVACRPTPDVEASVPGDESANEGTTAGEAEAPAYEVSLDALRADHPVENEGATCTNDTECDSPLRCVDFFCAFPPAMTGETHSSLVDATFVTDSGPVTFHLEVADARDEVTRGLMHRRTMAPDFGMLFVFDRDRLQSFWMRNTLIHLDMVFVHSNGTVDSVQAMAEPRTETSRRSEGPAQYVIELVGGTAERVGIVPGTQVTVPGYIEASP